MSRLGHTIARTTIWQILTDTDIRPSPSQSEVNPTEFLGSLATVACDYPPSTPPPLRRKNALFFIKVNTREVVCSGATANPTDDWTTQITRATCPPLR
ncbi:MAG: hypothetical protein HKN03_02255 [Acidimicrobiales bacterium]|nr:hypothetical protein [Acidimicrobiales bacterium]